MTAPTVADAQPTRWRGVAQGLGTVAMVGAAGLWALADAAIGTARLTDPDDQAVWLLVFLLVGAAATMALVWRRRWPFAICLLTAVLASVAPIGFFAPWWALVWVIMRERVRYIVVAAVATAAAIGITLTRDYVRGEHALLATIDEVSGESVVMHPAAFVAIGVVSLALAIGTGLVRRYRGAERAARAAELRQSRTAARLRTELSRQEERDLIAREMHDTVAHHLALVSLHASALEVTASDPGTDVPRAARSMRTSAQQALEEMRALIATLRTNAAGLAPDAPTGRAADLADLPVLIDEARRAGAQIAPTIMISDAHRAPPALTRAVYRIVQESLTNALKHAPGAPVMVDVRAAPGRGVRITVTNPPATPGPLGGGPGGTGLLGMHERVRALGGTVHITDDGGAHVVQADLPWVAADPGSAPPVPAGPPSGRAPGPWTGLVPEGHPSHVGGPS